MTSNEDTNISSAHYDPMSNRHMAYLDGEEFDLGNSFDVNPDDIPDDFHGIDLDRAVRLTPATMAFHVSQGLWQPADHLLFLASIIAKELLEGNAHLIVSMPPRHGKPIWVKEKVLRGDGTYTVLESVQVGDEVISHTGTPRKVTAVHEQGNLPCVRINTRGGRSIISALDHPFLTEKGWKSADDLIPEDKLAVVKHPRVYTQDEITLEEARLIGYFLGDGCCTFQNTGCDYETLFARLICHDPEELEDIYNVTHAMGFQIRHVGEGRYDLKGGVRDWLRKIGIAGMNSHTKRVPKQIFQSSEEVIANFIGAYFATDGSVGGHKRRMTVTPLFVSCNPLLLQDVQSLLLRLGIRSSLTSRWHTKGFLADKGGSAEFRLEIMRRYDVELFASVVPIYGVKRAALHQKMNDIFGNKRPQTLAFNGLFVDDEVVSVEEEGLLPCRCLTVETDETFTVQDVVVHNSELLSVWSALWWLDLFPEDNVILATYGAELSQGFSRRVRDMFVDLGGVDNKPSPDNKLEGRPRLRTSLNSSIMQSGHFQTTKNGGMVGVGVNGAITGRGANVFFIDDYVKNAEDAASPAQQAKTFDWLLSTAYTRLEPGGSMVILATRWDMNDLIGMIVKNQSEFMMNWKVIDLPAIALENDPLGRAPGDALWPQRYPLKRLLQIRSMLGSYFWSALYQQRPIKRSDVKFEDEQLKEVTELPHYSRLRKIRSWDLAGTEGGGDWTVGSLVSLDGLPRRTDTMCYVEDVIRDQVAQFRLEGLIRDTAEADGYDVPIVIEQEPGSSGKNYAKYLAETVLYGFKVTVRPPTSNKWLRAQPYMACVARGRARILSAAWNKLFRAEFRDFPGGSNDDIVDSVTQGFNELYGRKNTSPTWGRNVDEASRRLEEAAAIGRASRSGKLVTGATWGR